MVAASVGEPEEQEADEEKADGDGGSEEGDAGPAAGGFAGIDEPVGVPVGEGSADKGVGEIGDGIDDPEPDVSSNELRGWRPNEPVDHHDDGHEVVSDEVGPGDHAAVHVAEEKAEDDADDGDGDGRGAANDVAGFGWGLAAEEIDRADGEDDGDEEVGEDGEVAEEVDWVVAVLDEGVDEGPNECGKGEEAEEEACDGDCYVLHGVSWFFREVLARSLACGNVQGRSAVSQGDSVVDEPEGEAVCAFVRMPTSGESRYGAPDFMAAV